MQEIIYVVQASIENLENEVNSYTKKGYILNGTLVINRDTNDYKYIQCMVRDNSTEIKLNNPKPDVMMTLDKAKEILLNNNFELKKFSRVKMSLEADKKT